MLIERLCELSVELEAKGRVTPPHHKIRSVKWGLELDVDGEFLGWSRLGTDRRGLQLITPYRIRTGTRPPAFLLIDKLTYVLGQNVEARHDDGAHTWRGDLYAALIDDLVAYARKHSPGDVERIGAVARFLGDPEQVEGAVARAREDEQMRRDDIAMPYVDGLPLHELGVVRAFWGKRCDSVLEARSTLTADCMITGERVPIAHKHPGEVVLAGQTAQLVSVNSKAYESYGLSSAAIAPMGLETARRYSQALGYLLCRPEHTFRAGGVTYVFWLTGGLAFDRSSIFVRPPADVRARLRQLFLGEKRPDDAIDASRFYGVALSTNTRRIVVRDTIEASVGEVLGALDVWFGRQELMGADGKPIRPMGIFALAASTCQDAERIMPRVISGLMGAALLGRPLPAELLANAIGRARADTDSRLTRPRAVLIKMAVNERIRNDPTRGEEVGDRLDTNNVHPAYLCGRLFALLEGIQKAALGHDINTTIADKYYGTASSAPASVFGVLMRGAQPHLAKLRKTRGGAHHALQTRLEEVVGELDGFPKTLGLLDQGLFALGYYHQRGEDARARREYAEAKEHAADTAEGGA